jgi:NlpC/P60 family putative phage cell wall peptidase
LDRSIEAAQRAAVVAEARAWLGTPYHHNAMVKGAGVDCGMLLLAVYAAAGVIPADYDPGPYAFDWHLHRDEERYLAHVERFARRIEIDEVGPGDLGLWKFGRTFAHGAIFTQPPLVIHAVRKDGMVVMADASNDAELIEREAVFFSPWGRG